MYNMAIPPPSHMDGFCDDNDFIQDPELVWAELPQPFRMVDKVVNDIFGDAWAIIMNEEMRKEAERAIVRPPIFKAAREMKVQGIINHLVDSGDGNYVFVGLQTGLAAIDSSTDETVALWEEDDAAIMNIKSTVICERSYFLCTIDNMGIARVFAFANDTLYLIKKLNDQEGEKKVIAHKCETSLGGEYLGIAFENTSMDEWWLDVYQLPKEAWMKELENLKTIANKQMSESSKDLTVEKSMDSENNPPPDEMPQEDQLVADDQVRASHESSSEKQITHKFSAAGITQIMRAKCGPREISASHANSVTQALKTIESPDIIGSGENHLLTSASLSMRHQVFDFKNEKFLPFATTDEVLPESIPTFHFLTAGKVMPIGLEQSGSVAYLAVWWSGSSQMKTYSLLKSAKDLDRKPDVVWPFSQNIVASAVSACDATIAIGLQNGAVVLWDKYLGIQRKVITVPAAPLKLRFYDTTLTTEERYLESASYLMIQCVTGHTQLVPCGIKTDKDTEVLQVIPREEVLKNKPVRFVPIKSAPHIAVVTSLDGSIYICDIMKSRRLCEVRLPDTHQVTDTWNPVLTTTDQGRRLYVRGTSVVTGEEEEESDSSASASVFVFELDTLPILTEYWQKEQQKAVFPTTLLSLDNRISKILEERIKLQPARQLRMQENWRRLQDELTSKNATNNRSKGETVRFA